MKVSLNIIKQFIDFDLPPVDELVQKINMQLGGVEEVIDLSDKYKDAVIVRVVTCEKHPDADKLTICMVDDGGVCEGVERDGNGHVQVVCGAPNVRADILAVWLPPNSTVPASYDTPEPFVLSVRDIRGVRSSGMLAASDELAIGGDHAGIIELKDSDLSPKSTIQNLKSGLSFAETFGLDDTIIDIENKMFTHRPDCFGQLGVAREIAGITGQQFTSPDWYKVLPKFNRGEGLELHVENNASTVVPRLMAVAIKDVAVKPSPLWLQCELVRLGSKPINNIVDVTNYSMLLTGQPTHAYDYDKLRGHTLVARFAKDGEQLTLLNNKTYQLTRDDIVIADADGAVGLAGIMGGRDSEVSDTTTNIVLECANFDMYAVRKTSMRHGVFTDALTRFNKGQSPHQNPYVLGILLASLHDVAGGMQASEVFDIANYESRTVNHEIQMSTSFINDRLGVVIDGEEVTILLANVEFAVRARISPDSHDVTITPPFWRTDIESCEDIVEEVGRLYGFDKLPRELPRRSSVPAPKNARRVLKQRIRDSLSRAGANEVLTYSFVHEQVMKRAEQDVLRAFRLGNAISPDLQYYRLSVLPSLLDKVHANVKLGYDEFVLFEIGKGHDKKDHAADDNGLPRELDVVDAVYTSRQPKDGAPYYRMRRLVQQLARDLGYTLRFHPVAAPSDIPATAPFDPARSATLTTRSDEYIGMVGELKPSVLRAFKLPPYTAALTLDLAALEQATSLRHTSYKPLSKFPTITQDISLRLASDTTYEQVFHVVWEAATEKTPGIDVRVSPVAVYQAATADAHKTVTLHLAFTSYDTTLTDGDINTVMEHVTERAAAALAAERI